MRRRLSLLAVLVLSVTGIGAFAPGDPDEPQTVRGQSVPKYPSSITEVYEVETPYGTIRGDVQRPVVPDGMKVPVILTYTPYSVLYETLAPGRESRADDAVADYFVPRGYARAVFDVVGTYGSEGCTDFGGRGERETAAAVVDFLGDQGWSNGRVGMIGASYDGTTAIAAAVEAPQHLVTVVPQVAIDRWYDYMYNDGVKMTLEDNTTGLIDPPLNSPVDYDTVYGVIPPYPQLSDDPAGVAGILADHLNPCNRVENQTRGYEPDPVYDDFWVERDYRALASGVQASVLLEGAWLDDNVKHWATTRFFDALPEIAADGAPFPKRMVMGQWSHSTSQFPDAQDLRHAWFDYFLLGLDTGVLALPPVDTQGSDGVRRQQSQWPPVGTEIRTFAVTDGAPAADTFGSNGAAPTWTDVDPFLVEQQIADGLCGSACVRFDAAPVDADVRIVGAPILEFAGTTDLTSTHVVPHLLDVAPDGSVEVITRGLFNSNNREGLDQSVPLEPGTSWSATIELWDTDWTLAAGHHLALVVTSADATWGLADETRATTTLDTAVTAIRVPMAAAG